MWPEIKEWLPEDMKRTEISITVRGISNPEIPRIGLLWEIVR